MTPSHACPSALAMRRRLLRRKRIARAATLVHHGFALVGIGFILAIVFNAY